MKPDDLAKSTSEQEDEEDENEMSITSFREYTSDLYFHSYLLMKAFVEKRGVETLMEIYLSVLNSDTAEVA